MTALEKLGIRIEEATRKRLRMAAKRTGASQAEIVRRILKKHLK